MISHRFHLRPDLALTVDLPSDLTSGSAVESVRNFPSVFRGVTPRGASRYGKDGKRIG
jgi:hypothetical protein